MTFPGPDFVSKLHGTILESEAVVFNLLLFLKFVLHEIESMRKRRRKRGPT